MYKNRFTWSKAGNKSDKILHRGNQQGIWAEGGKEILHRDNQQGIWAEGRKASTIIVLGSERPPLI